MDFLFNCPTSFYNQPRKFINILTDDQLAKMIQQLTQGLQIDTLNMLDSQRLVLVLKKTDNDDIVNMFNDQPQEFVRKIKSNLNAEDSSSVEKLMNYPMETAGRIMTDRYVWIPQNFTIRNAIEKIKDFSEISELISYIYIVNNEHKLLGRVSFKDLILSELDEFIQNKMDTHIITVSAFADQEDAVKLIERYDLDSIPVVENNDVLIGVITSDDIIDVVIKEANEDIEKLSASGRAITFQTKSYIAAGRRLPWLILLLSIGIISGSIISGFEASLQKVVALAFFVPMITGMTGNTGTQSLAIVVRGIAAEDIDDKTMIAIVFRELKVGIIIGAVCGLLISIIGYIWQGNLMMGIVVGASLFITLIIGTLTGTIIPLVLHKLKIDPAVASGPLITTIDDILSLLIYFGIATALISKIS